MMRFAGCPAAAPFVEHEIQGHKQNIEKKQLGG
jgi:hypothetical protein